MKTCWLKQSNTYTSRWEINVGVITNTGLAQMIARKHALKLELAGLKHSGGSVYALVKRTHGLRGNKQSVFTQYCELVEKAKGEVM